MLLLHTNTGAVPLSLQNGPVLRPSDRVKERTEPLIIIIMDRRCGDSGRFFIKNNENVEDDFEG